METGPTREISHRERKLQAEEKGVHAPTHASPNELRVLIILQKENMKMGGSTWVVEEEQAMPCIQEGGRVGGCCWSH